MRFGIRDILLLMVVIALAVAVVQLTLRFRHKSTEYQAVQASLANARQTHTSQRSLDAYRDELTEVQSAYAASLIGFNEFQAKYSKLEPVAGKVSFRTVPTLNSYSEVHFKLHVPKEYPVYLRAGIRVEDQTSSSPASFDTLVWENVAGFPFCGPWEAQLKPGENGFILAMEIGAMEVGNTIHLILNGLPLYDVGLPGTCRHMGRSHSSGREQFNLGREDLSRFTCRCTLRGSEANSPSEQRYEVVHWLSAEPSHEKVRPSQPLLQKQGASHE